MKIESNTVATNLYHIIQESVNNAIIHGNAGKIVIKLVFNDSGINLCIKDNGSGFDIEGDKSGIGLRIFFYIRRTVKL